MSCTGQSGQARPSSSTGSPSSWSASRALASSLSSLLTALRRSQILSLGDEKSSAEDNASKTIALDHLGVIGAQIKTSMVQVASRVKEGETSRSISEVRRDARDEDRSLKL